MIYISHRGNLNGRNIKKENTIDYITNAIYLGFYVEIDIRTKNTEFYLGHDNAQYPVSIDWLLKNSNFLFIHTKDFDSLNKLINYNKLKIFFHSCEEHVIINNTNLIWSHNIKEASEKSIIPLLDIDSIRNYKITNNIYGICSDYVSVLKENYVEN